MEDSHSFRTNWGVDTKAMQQCLTDIFTSVYTTCDIPENAIFGPCALSHTSMYDSIAFIALKSTDKRSAPYILRVDTSAVSGHSEVLVWLRLVQSARDCEEQNLEAYIKNGQLFYRSLRRIQKDEELLVWYGKDLMALLLLSSSKALGKCKGAPPYLCLDCNQRFQFEFPFLAHLRFCCSKGLCHINGALGDLKDIHNRGDRIPLRSSPEILCLDGRSKSKDAKPVTDFHNLARDLENSRARSPSSVEGESRCGSKRKYSEEGETRSRCSSESPLSKEDLECPAQQRREALSLAGSRECISNSCPAPVNMKKSAFTEVRKASEGLKQGRNVENRSRVCTTERHASVRLAQTELRPRTESPRSGSAFSSVSRHMGCQDRASAFTQPTHSNSQLAPLTLTSKFFSSTHCHPSMVDARRLQQADHLVSKLRSQDLLQEGSPKHNPFLFATPHWPKALVTAQMQVPSALSFLPPSFNSMSLPAQNWCAKCNASFRMTSDLVYHMRSHHKKESGVEPLVKRRREEKLKCPVCSESFRERHHLSRHMTSHN